MAIVILDYGLGNIKSLQNAFKSQGYNVLVTRDKKIILDSEGLVLPGVGAFPEGMKNLKKYELDKTIIEFVNTGKPLLGVCLGMQMLMEESHEFEYTKGLGLIKGGVKKIPLEKSPNIKLPHVSWNEIYKKKLIGVIQS